VLSVPKNPEIQPNCTASNFRFCAMEQLLPNALRAVQVFITNSQTQNSCKNVAKFSVGRPPLLPHRTNRICISFQTACGWPLTDISTAYASGAELTPLPTPASNACKNCENCKLEVGLPPSMDQGKVPCAYLYLADTSHSYFYKLLASAPPDDRFLAVDQGQTRQIWLVKLNSA